MLVGGRILEVSAKKTNDEAKSGGLDFSMNIANVSRQGKRIVVAYDYLITYKPDIASMKISGELFFEMDEVAAKKVDDDFKKNKFISQELAEEVLNASNYTASSVGTLLAFSINVGAPLNLPKTKLEIKPAGANAKAS